MWKSDPMGYTMEQLVKALAAETMNEIGFDDAEVEEPLQTETMWDHIAKVTIDEISSLYESEDIHPYGYRADEVVHTMRPLLEPYGVYPASHKLLSAIESTLTNSGKDPRPYTNLVVRILDNDSAKDWRNKRAFK